ncbi:MAG: HNH endonuclease [candidate division KSB1 bacterium]|nr:HNH endonuclease [candidate division KSB1 bacterium]MDZ7367460.1 HNH endonuclease [candidate division KSB1 bacterium]MDZ7405435.1 HNH endonuclease [candidate division KSB1 bacterium]
MSSAYIPAALRRQLLLESDQRCAYCRSSEIYTGAPLVVEHIVPRALKGKTTYNNLCLACHRCNEYKGGRIAAMDTLTKETVPLFNPRSQHWREHFMWSRDGIEIIGITPCGRATVEALRLNNENVVTARYVWTKVGFHPPFE